MLLLRHVAVFRVRLNATVTPRTSGHWERAPRLPKLFAQGAPSPGSINNDSHPPPATDAGNERLICTSRCCSQLFRTVS